MTSILALLTSLALGHSSCAAPVPRPNVLFILCVSMLQRLGIEPDRFASATGSMQGL